MLAALAERLYTVAGKAKPSARAFPLPLAQVSRRGDAGAALGPGPRARRRAALSAADLAGPPLARVGGPRQTNARGVYWVTVRAAAGESVQAWSPRDGAYGCRCGSASGERAITTIATTISTTTIASRMTRNALRSPGPGPGSGVYGSSGGAGWRGESSSPSSTCGSCWISRSATKGFTAALTDAETEREQRRLTVVGSHVERNRDAPHRHARRILHGRSCSSCPRTPSERRCRIASRRHEGRHPRRRQAARGSIRSPGSRTSTCCRSTTGRWSRTRSRRSSSAGVDRAHARHRRHARRRVPAPARQRARVRDRRALSTPTRSGRAGSRRRSASRSASSAATASS